MYDEDDICAIIKKVNPKSKQAKQSAKEKKKVLQQRNAPVNRKATPPKPKSVRRERPLQAQDMTGYYSSDNTTILHKSGNMYWTLVPEDAAKLSNEQIFKYMYKRFGYKAHEIEVIRPKN